MQVDQNEVGAGAGVIAEEYVRVSGWNRLRLVENRGNEVAMEVARINCSHCSTCSRRMNTVTGNVHSAGLLVKWEDRRGGKIIVIPLPKGFDPVEHLRNVLKLNIYRP